MARVGEAHGVAVAAAAEEGAPRSLAVVCKEKITYTMCLACATVIIFAGADLVAVAVFCVSFVPLGFI